ncbi:MAG: CPBP family intramembrane glutamic endopeptidase [Chthoniobacterales bacterium]
MDLETLLIVALGCGSLYSLWFYGRAFGEYAKGRNCNVEVAEYSLTDAALAAILSCWFLLMTYAGFQHHNEVTLQDVITGDAIYGSIVLFLFGFLLLQNKDVLKLYGLGNFNFLKNLECLLALLPILYFLQEVASRYLSKDQPPQSLVSFILQHHDPAIISVVLISICVIAPITEELLFRGFLYGVLSRYFGRLAAMLVSSLLFAAMHAHLPSFPALFIMGIFLTLAYERTGSLWTSIFMHSCFNALSFSLILWFPALQR